MPSIIGSSTISGNISTSSSAAVTGPTGNTGSAGPIGPTGGTGITGGGTGATGVWISLVSSNLNTDTITFTLSDGEAYSFTGFTGPPANYSNSKFENTITGTSYKNPIKGVSFGITFEFRGISGSGNIVSELSSDKTEILLKIKPTPGSAASPSGITSGYLIFADDDRIAFPSGIGITGSNNYLTFGLPRDGSSADRVSLYVDVEQKVKTIQSLTETASSPTLDDVVLGRDAGGYLLDLRKYSAYNMSTPIGITSFVGDNIPGTVQSWTFFIHGADVWNLPNNLYFDINDNSGLGRASFLKGTNILNVWTWDGGVNYHANFAARGIGYTGAQYTTGLGSCCYNPGSGLTCADYQTPDWCEARSGQFSALTDCSRACENLGFCCINRTCYPSLSKTICESLAGVWNLLTCPSGCGNSNILKTATINTKGQSDIILIPREAGTDDIVEVKVSIKPDTEEDAVSFKLITEDRSQFELSSGPIAASLFYVQKNGTSVTSTQMYNGVTAINGDTLNLYVKTDSGVLKGIKDFDSSVFNGGGILISNSEATLNKYLPILTNPNACSECFDTQYIQTSLVATNKCFDCVRVNTDQSDNEKAKDSSYIPLQSTVASVSLCVTTDPTKWNWNSKPYKINCIRGLTAVNLDDCSETYFNANNGDNPPTPLSGVTFCKHIKYKNILPPGERSGPGLDCDSVITLGDGNEFNCGTAIQYNDNGTDVTHCKGDETTLTSGIPGITAYFTELGGNLRTRLQSELPQGITLNEVMGDILNYMEGLTVGSTDTKFLFTWEGRNQYFEIEPNELNVAISRKCCTDSEIFTGNFSRDKYNEMADLCEYQWNKVIQYEPSMPSTINLKYAEDQVLNLGKENTTNPTTQTFSFYANGVVAAAPPVGFVAAEYSNGVKDIQMGSGWFALLDKNNKIRGFTLASNNSSINSFINRVNSNSSISFSSISAGPNFLVGIREDNYGITAWAASGANGVTAPAGITGIKIFNNNQFVTLGQNDPGTARTVYVKEKSDTSTQWLTRGLLGWGGNISVNNSINILNQSSTFNTQMPAYLKRSAFNKTEPGEPSVPEPSRQPISLVAFLGDNAIMTYLAYVPNAKQADGQTNNLFVWPSTTAVAVATPDELFTAANDNKILDVKAGKRFFIALANVGNKNKIYMWGRWNDPQNTIPGSVNNQINSINGEPNKYPEQIGVGPGDLRAWVVMNDGEIRLLFDDTDTSIGIPPVPVSPPLSPASTRKIITSNNSNTINSIMLETAPQADQYEYWLFGQFGTTKNLCRTPYICEGECSDGNSSSGPCIGDDADEQLLEGWFTRASNTFILLRVEVNPDDGTIKDPSAPGCLITLPAQYYGDGFQSKANTFVTNLNKGCVIKYSSPNFRCAESGNAGGLNPEPDKVQTAFSYLGRIRKNQLRNPTLNSNRDIVGNLDFSPVQFGSINPRSFCWFSHCPGGPIFYKQSQFSCYGCYPCVPSSGANYFQPTPVHMFAKGWGLLDRPYGYVPTPPLFVDSTEFTGKAEEEVEKEMFKKEYIFDKTYSKFLCKSAFLTPDTVPPVVCDATQYSPVSCNEFKNNELYWSNVQNHQLMWPRQCTASELFNHDQYDVKIAVKREYDNTAGLTAVIPTVFKIDKQSYVTTIENSEYVYYLDGITAHEPQLVRSGDKVYLRGKADYGVSDSSLSFIPMDQSVHFFYIDGTNTPFANHNKLIKSTTSYTNREPDEGKSLYIDDVGIPVTDLIIQEYTPTPPLGFLDSTIKLDFKTIYSKSAAILNLITRNEQAGMITSGDIVTLGDSNNIKIKYILWQPKDASTGSSTSQNKYEIDSNIDTNFDTPIETRHGYIGEYLEIKTKNLMPSDGIDFSGNLLINGIVQLEYSVHCIPSNGNAYYNQPRTAVLYLNRKKNFDNIRSGRLSCLDVNGTCIQVNCTDPLNDDICRKYRWCETDGGCP